MANNDNIRSISGMSADELMRLAENGVLLEYGGIAIKVGPAMLATAQHYIDESAVKNAGWTRFRRPGR